MTISRLISAVIESDPHTGGANRTVQPRLGSLLRGDVLEIRPGGKALVEFGNIRVLADLPFATKPGTTIQVRVADPVNMDIDTAGRWTSGFFQQRTIDTNA